MQKFVLELSSSTDSGPLWGPFLGQIETQILAKLLVKSSIPISRDGKMMNQDEFLYNLGLCKSKTLFHGRNVVPIAEGKKRKFDS